MSFFGSKLMVRSDKAIMYSKISLIWHLHTEYTFTASIG